MVAKNIRLPNIRKFFVPDPGYTIVDADLAGADAQIVAWEANELAMKEAFRKGEKIHIRNARDTWPEKTASMSDADIKASVIYKEAKIACHGTNYGGKPPTLASILKWTVSLAYDFQERYFAARPGIHEWHRRIERYLTGEQCWNCNTMADNPFGRCESCSVPLGRTVKNQFGFRRVYFERIDSLLPQALAWIPQSSVALCTEIGWMQVAESPEWKDIVQFLLQVHDSNVFQIPSEYDPAIPEIVKAMEVPVPYADPLTIPMNWGSSRTAWGDISD